MGSDGYFVGITVVGLSDGIGVMTFVRGFNLTKNITMRELSRYKLLVTFNGISFDVPVMKRFFGSFPKMPHVDLRFVCQKAGYSGGLKAIEKQFGISRRDEVVGVTGSDAVDLWHLWRATGERDYLNKLVAYNEEDILNLKPLAKKVIPELWSKLRSI